MSVLSSYEDVPYESRPLYPTHPDCISTVGTLFGLQPALPSKCRVLELGCASGGNLLPMAQDLPGSQFVGIDLSPGQVAVGLEAIRALGLRNLELRAESILDFPRDAGTFDYILCHGVYSWVPTAVQDKILDICGRHLAPHGIAYLSYNTFPGWHRRRMVREILGMQTQGIADAKQRVERARAYLNFLVAAAEQGSSYQRFLQEEAETLKGSPDSYLFHEHLEDENNPVYFRDFMARAESHALQYLGESYYHTDLDGLPEQVREVLFELSDSLVDLEQQIDLIRNRTFRRTLLCRGEAQVVRQPTLAALQRLYVGALAKPSAPRGAPGTSATFDGRHGGTMTTADPLLTQALYEVYEQWPQVVPFGELVDRAAQGMPRDRAAAHLGEGLLRCYLANLVSLHTHRPALTRTPGARPECSPLARYQIARGFKLITTLRHSQTEVGELDRRAALLADGTRDRAAMAAELPDSDLEAALTRLAMSSLLRDVSASGSARA